MKKKEKQQEEGAKIWDCGSPLYDSYELASVGRILKRYTTPAPALPFLSTSESSEEDRIVKMKPKWSSLWRWKMIKKGNDGDQKKVKKLTGFYSVFRTLGLHRKREI